MDRIEQLGELYQKLKGSIFLRLVPSWKWDVTYPKVKDSISSPINRDECIFELEEDMNFEQFVDKQEAENGKI